jgi:hypothetical protein
LRTQQLPCAWATVWIRDRPLPGFPSPESSVSCPRFPSSVSHTTCARRSEACGRGSWRPRLDTAGSTGDGSRRRSDAGWPWAAHEHLESGPSGYMHAGRVRVVRKELAFWPKRSPNCDFYGRSTFSIITQHDGWVRREG